LSIPGLDVHSATVPRVWPPCGCLFLSCVCRRLLYIVCFKVNYSGLAKFHLVGCGRKLRPAHREVQVWAALAVRYCQSFKPLKPKVVWTMFKHSFPTAKRTRHFTFSNTKWLTLFKGIIVYTEIHTEPIKYIL
jgi:hypothetical protein